MVPLMHCSFAAPSMPSTPTMEAEVLPDRHRLSTTGSVELSVTCRASFTSPQVAWRETSGVTITLRGATGLTTIRALTMRSLVPGEGGGALTVRDLGPGL